MKQTRPPRLLLPRRTGYTKFSRGAHIWQPVSTAPRVPDDDQVLYQRFSDREPADFIQLDIEGDGRTLRLVSDHGGPIAPPKQKRSPPSRRRFTRVRLEFPTKHVFDHVELPRDGGPIRAVARGIEVLPELAIVETIYRRSKAVHKPKVLNRIVLHDERPCSGIHTTLERFDHLFCADTNTLSHRGGYVWVTAICSGEVRRLSADDAVLQWRHVEVLYTRATDESSGELQGWSAAIAFLEHTRHLVPGRRALVVDAHLQNLDSYSTRQRALFGDTFLPAQWHLVYASSDAGTQEFLPNVMLARAHRNSMVIARRLKKRPFFQLWPAIVPPRGTPR